MNQVRLSVSYGEKNACKQWVAPSLLMEDTWRFVPGYRGDAGSYFLSTTSDVN